MKKLLCTLLSLGVMLCAGFLSPAFAKSFSDPSIGKKTAPVTIEIFNIFECPHCANLHTTLASKEIQRLITRGKIRLVLRDLRDSPPAQAVNAAGYVSPAKAKKMVDLIFTRQAEWSAKSYPLVTFLSYAEKLNIDPEAFLKAYRDPENLVEIKADIEDANLRKIDSAPTYFINGKKYVGAVGVEELLMEIGNAQ